MFQIIHEKGSEETLFHQSRRKTSERIRLHSNQSRPEATDRNIGVQAAPWQLQRWPVNRLCPPSPLQRFVHFPIPFFLPSFPWPAERAEGRTISRSLMDHLRSLGDKRGDRCGGKHWRCRGGTATASKRFAMTKSWLRLCDYTFTAVNRLKFVIKEL